MQQKIADNINNPEALEKLYKEDKTNFTQSIKEVAKNNQSDLINFWLIRLNNDETPETKRVKTVDLIIVVIIALFTGLLAKAPSVFTQIELSDFYTRYLAIIVFNGLILYTFWHHQLLNKKSLLIYGTTTSILLLYISWLPDANSDTIFLALIHLPLLLWVLFGLVYIKFNFKNITQRIEFIQMNGELIIMTGLILIAGGLLTAVTIALFSAINMDIENFYSKNIVLFGAVASPTVAFFLIKTHPNVTSKIAPVVAKIFTPLVLITLAIYLVSLLFSKSNILENRDLLIVFNIMLLAVMAIILFSISELNKTKPKNPNTLILLLLALLTIAINAIALTAIITRITYGLTPNRVVVLVSNVLIFGNLILIAKDLFKSYFLSTHIGSIEKTVAKYLTIYLIWTLIVIFILPLIFNFK